MTAAALTALAELDALEAAARRWRAASDEYDAQEIGNDTAAWRAARLERAAALRELSVTAYEYACAEATA